MIDLGEVCLICVIIESLSIYQATCFDWKQTQSPKVNNKPCAL